MPVIHTTGVETDPGFSINLQLIGIFFCWLSLSMADCILALTQRRISQGPVSSRKELLHSSRYLNIRDKASWAEQEDQL